MTPQAAMAVSLGVCLAAFILFTVVVLKMTYRLDFPPSRLHDCLIEVGGALLLLFSLTAVLP